MDRGIEMADWTTNLNRFRKRFINKIIIPTRQIVRHTEKVHLEHLYDKIKSKKEYDDTVYDEVTESLKRKDQKQKLKDIIRKGVEK